MLRSKRIAALTACVAALSAGAGAAQAQTPATPVGELGIDEFSVKALDWTGNGTDTVPVTQAGAHPDVLEVYVKTAQYTGPNGRPSPTASLKDIEVELPAGLVGNPQATPKCDAASIDDCPPETRVGAHLLEWTNGSSTADELDAIYNLVPPPGVVARFGFEAVAVPVVYDVTVNDDGRYTITTNVRDISTTLQVRGSRTWLFGVPQESTGSGKDVFVNGPAPSGSAPRPFLTLGSECGVEKVAKLLVNSWQKPGTYLDLESKQPALTGCERLSFAPSLDLRPVANQPAVPSGFDVRVDVPQNEAASGVGTPSVRKVDVLMPNGVAINPAGAQGLVGCTDEQVALRSLADPACPGASKIGTVEIDTPVLDERMTGSVYLGQPKSQVASSGDMFRLFLVAEGSDVTIKQEGRITPDPATGRLRAVFDQVPELPFSSLRMALKDGPRAPLTTPSACGTHTTTATITSWGGQTATSSSSFETACRAGLGGFTPTFLAGSDRPVAGAYTPFGLTITRPDGESALTTMRFELPPGLLASLRGNVGRQVGSATAHAGVGSSPFGLPGTVVLEGPYGDAPFSLRATVPAVAGPYNLGDVVVRQKLYIDPDDAHVTIVSDPLPTILQGVPVQLQRLDVRIDRERFMVNPTSCAPRSIRADLGAASGASARRDAPYGVAGCGDLAFTPELSLGLTDPTQTKDGGHPGLRAELTPPAGQANLGTVAVKLPLALALDPDNSASESLCSYEGGLAANCPESSIVGTASAVSPLLNEPMTGPVHFVKNVRFNAAGRAIRTLPTLLVKLRGENGLRINLRAKSDVEDEHLVTTFERIPDVPVERFSLSLNGGPKGILVVTGGQDVCGLDPNTGEPMGPAEVAMKGQNGRWHEREVRFTTPCGVTVLSRSYSPSRMIVRLGNLGAGTVRISGTGVKTTTRTIKRAKTARVSAPLTATGKRMRAARKTLVIRASFTPAGAGAKVQTATYPAPKKKAAAKKRAAAVKRR